MRGRRFLADLVDLAIALLVAVPLALPLFALGDPFEWDEAFVGGLGRTLEPLVDPMLSLRLVALSIGIAWLGVFILVRAGKGPTTGELLAGLRPPAHPRARPKMWLRALFVFDLPLGWVLAARPIDRLLGTGAERDHTRTWLETLGNLQRKKPMTFPAAAVLLLVLLSSTPGWRAALEAHHRQLIAQTYAQFGGFCDGFLAWPRGKQIVRAAARAEWLAPNAFQSHVPAGSDERRTLEQAMALLEGPCGALRPGEAVPDGAVDGAAPQGWRTVLWADLDELRTRCSSQWRYGVAQPGCGRFLELSDAFSARTNSGKLARCGVYAREGRIAAVVARCEP